MGGDFIPDIMKSVSSVFKNPKSKVTVGGRPATSTERTTFGNRIQGLFGDQPGEQISKSESARQVSNEGGQARQAKKPSAATKKFAPQPIKKVFKSSPSGGRKSLLGV